MKETLFRQTPGQRAHRTSLQQDLYTRYSCPQVWSIHFWLVLPFHAICQQHLFPNSLTLFHSNLSLPILPSAKLEDTICHSSYPFCLCSPVPFSLSRWYLLQNRHPNPYSALQNTQVLEGFEWRRKEAKHVFGFLKEDVVSAPASCSGHRAAAVLPFVLGLHLHWMLGTRQPCSWSALKYYSKKYSYKYDSI